MIRKMFLTMSLLALGLFSVQAATVDGVVSATTGGAAISGAIVTLTPLIGTGTTYKDTTNATGNYSMATVAAGTYTITAAAAGHTTSTGAMVNVANATSTVTHNITLAVKPTGITISGAVTDSASGTPLSGAIVRLRTTGFGGTTIDSVKTATNGTYSLDSVQAGTYSINVTAAGHIAETVNNIVAAATNLTRNFQLVGTPAGIKITGTVTDSATGTPLASAKIRLRTGNGGGVTVIDSVVSAANGTYTLDSVQAGTYSINVTAAGHTAQTVNNIVVAATAITRNFPLVAIPAGIKITGTVTDSATGTPIAGAKVRLRTGNGGGATVIDSVVSATNGTYTLDSVQAGTYTINVTATGFTAQTTNNIVVAATAITRNFPLVALPAGITISGTVTNATGGAAITGAVVHLRSGLTVIDSTVTAANGTYSIAGVQAGNYTMTASKTGFTTQTVNGVTVAAANITRNFQLAGAIGGVTISGNVADSVSGNPLSGAVVHLIQGATLIDTVIVATNGSYSLPNVQAGTYSITVTAASHIHKTQSSLVVANTAIVLNFLLIMGTDNVSYSSAKNVAQPNFTISKSGIVSLSNMTENGVLSMISLNGKLIYRTSIVGKSASVKLPENIARTSGVFLVSITQKNLVLNKQIVR